MTSIKHFTEAKVHNVNVPVEIRIANARAGINDLDNILKSLEKDRAMLHEIYSALGYTDELKVFDELPNTVITGQSVKALHRSYLNLLARTLLRSTSADFSDAVRTRFGARTILVAPGSKELSNENVDALQSKFLNLLELHGEVRQPNIWERLSFWIRGFFIRNNESNQSNEVVNG